MAYNIAPGDRVWIPNRKRKRVMRVRRVHSAFYGSVRRLRIMVATTPPEWFWSDEVERYGA